MVVAVGVVVVVAIRKRIEGLKEGEQCEKFKGKEHREKLIWILDLAYSTRALLFAYVAVVFFC
jgi:hypothetical protein